MKSTSKPTARRKTAAPAVRRTRVATPKPPAITHKEVAVPAVRRTSVATPRPPAITHKEIAARAYEIYAASGHQPGREVEFWLEAERQLQRRLKS